MRDRQSNIPETTSIVNNNSIYVIYYIIFICQTSCMKKNIYHFFETGVNTVIMLINTHYNRLFIN